MGEVVVVDVKPIWRSKTFWFNALLILMQFLAQFLGAGYFASKYTVPVVGGLNILLRLISADRVTLTGASPDPDPVDDRSVAGEDE